MTLTAVRSSPVAPSTPLTNVAAPQQGVNASPLCEAPIDAHDENQLKMLEVCGYKDGKVSANVDPMFWNWLNFVTPEFIAQAYVDALMVAGRHSSGSASAAVLIKESGAMNLNDEQLKEFQAQIDYAQGKIEELAKKEKNSEASCLSRSSISFKDSRQYKKQTGRELKTDYSVYVAGLDFAERMRQIASEPSFEESQKEMQGLLAAQPKHAATIVIALNRLLKAWGRY